MYVKVCGATSIDDAVLCVECGADAIGLNLIPSSKRYIDETTARNIVRAVGQRVPCVGVVAGYPLKKLIELQRRIGLHALQLHGDEPGEWLQSLGANSYCAARIREAKDVRCARELPGRMVLTDARVDGELGGTGHAFDWSLVIELAAERRLILAGGLTPSNVGRAVQTVKPYAVDVASGVEAAGDPRRKDRSLVERFVKEARKAHPTANEGDFFSLP